MSIQRIAVVGAGAMGGYLGAILAQSGRDVTFIARGVNLAALKAHGIRVRIDSSDQFTVPVAASDDPDTVGPVDLIIVAVKTYDLDAATLQMRSLVGPETAILTVQNGIDAAGRVGEVLGVPGVLAAALFFATRRAESGVIEKAAGAGGSLLLGDPAGGPTSRAESVTATLRAAGFDAQLPTDIRVALWEKFLAISSRGTLSALTRLPGGPLVGCAETMQLLSGLITEGAAVANASGIPLTEDRVAHIVELVRHFPPQVRSSQYDDLVAGRRLELEALNGTIVRLGSVHGVATPLNFAVYAALKPYVNGAT
jgi:2-dehydropantoate 2-reductase